MSLELYYHPLASYCWKALIALYEADLHFEKRLVDLGNVAERAAFLEISPFGKFPVLRDGDRIILESSILIEYLARTFDQAARLVPGAQDAALEVRARDRFFDLYIHEPMQKIVGDRLRPEGAADAYGVAEAHARLDTAYGVLESALGTAGWAAGAVFTLADCAAAPALFYADKVHPIGPANRRTRAYLERLSERPAFARVLREADPYFAMFPG